MRHIVKKKFSNPEVQAAYDKMASSCQAGSKSWRNDGKKFYLLLKENKLPIEPWMENYFGRITA